MRVEKSVRFFYVTLYVVLYQLEYHPYSLYKIKTIIGTRLGNILY